MTNHIFQFTSPIVAKPRKNHISVTLHTEKSFKTWLKKQKASVKSYVSEHPFKASTGQVLILRDSKNTIKSIHAGVSTPFKYYDGASVAASIKGTLCDDFLKTCSFDVDTKLLSDIEAEQFFTSWVLSGYSFGAYKQDKPKTIAPAITLPKTVKKKRVVDFAKSIFILRNLVNTPANGMGPAQLEKAATAIASTFKAKVKVIKDKELKKQNFPLVYTVGEAAANDRRPRLVDIRWGKKSDPKITLVGKGVCYDTGGLNLKPGQYMKNMKKDMGGAAHVLAVAYMVMANKLPVNLRVLVPAVENSVSGPAFRPGDVLDSRKGIRVENTNTDAEGRLILADSLTYAAEDTPDLIIDFATLTGSARAALGPDVPAMFSNDRKIGQKLEAISGEVQDQVWNMPLWQPYRKNIKATTGDIVNSASMPGDLIYSALFLESFLPDKNPPNWVHLDVFAWSDSPSAGRAKEGNDTGARAVYAYLEDTYGGK